MAIVKIPQLSLVLNVNDGENLLQALKRHQVTIRSFCNGQGQCGECRVLIRQGQWNLLPPITQEQHHLGNVTFLDGRRLACFVQVFGEIEIDISEHLHRDETHRRLKGWDQKPVVHATTHSLILDEVDKESQSR